jgi:hypothetical protein
MKIDREARIGGQPLKLVRNVLRRQRDGYISVENIVEHLQQNWWHEFVEGLFERGVINREARNSGRKHFNRGREKIFGVQVPKMPDFSTPAQTLFDHLLAEGYIEHTACWITLHLPFLGTGGIRPATFPRFAFNCCLAT